ncbi:FAD/NAD(P)-dependent oxidoreductase [Desulfogranum mediterraneum]|uniref:FAD/NAD(P)-dependent oxidoreductase n=1 Tax=Desulfogranum mediterraneum TaxID=160661 RepID=UPI0004261F26|nr:NAD(P)/FAD-dependent oxidoreductase [Desulfogranum mediterraneum]
MNRRTDLLVIGAGPAGLAAAVSARDCGLEVTLIDEQAAPGGQLFRNIESPLGQQALQARERAQGMELVRAFRASGAAYCPKTTIWGLEPGRVSCTLEGVPATLEASAIIVAPGAMERPVPFPGWTLPGVMGAGGADILLRSGGTLDKDPAAPVVLAGNGPLLLLLAGHLLQAGVKIVAWLDTGCWSQRLRALPLMPAAALDPAYLNKGVKMALQVLKGKIPLIRGVSDIRALGEGQLEQVSYRKRGKRYLLGAATLLRHEGIIPRTHILNSLRIEHHWDRVQRYWYPLLDQDGATSIAGLFLAGDAGYVHGGDASQLKGSMSGVAAARYLGVISKEEAADRSAAPRKQLQTMRISRGYLRHLFAPHPQLFKVPDETMVCRCECVTAGEIRKAVAEGCTEVNEVKLFSRCGMGPCQGRMCGPALAEITAAACSTGVESVGSLRIRQPFRPVSLENYCDLHHPLPDQQP